jgi:chorismate dehydratase
VTRRARRHTAVGGGGGASVGWPPGATATTDLVGAGPAVGERLGIVAYTNVAPLHWGLEPWPGARFHRGVPTDLNARLLAGELDLTLVSSAEFVRHRDRLVALPDFSIATLGPVHSVTLFHRRPWAELDGGRVAVTTESATSVALLRTLFDADRMQVAFEPCTPDLDAMLGGYDGALLIGDAALEEAVARRPIAGAVPLATDLGEAWYARTKLPFTFAVWAADAARPPSVRLVAELRAARERGLGHLAEVARAEAAARGLSEAVVLRYLANFRYFLTPPDRDGLDAFATRIDPSFRPGELRFWDL